MQPKEDIAASKNILAIGDASDQFTVSDIANSLGMFREEKTISRVLQELRRVHSTRIQQINVRNGKVFQYYYSIKQKQKAN